MYSEETYLVVVDVCSTCTNVILGLSNSRVKTGNPQTNNLVTPRIVYTHSAGDRYSMWLWREMSSLAGERESYYAASRHFQQFLYFTETQLTESKVPRLLVKDYPYTYVAYAAVTQKVCFSCRKKVHYCCPWPVEPGSAWTVRR